MRAGGLRRLRPTKSFVGLLFLFGAMWYAAASQNNAASYLLLFTLSAVVLVSVPHTIFNLSGLTLSAESIRPSFAGQEVSLPVELLNGARAARRSLAISIPDSEGADEVVDEIAAGKAARVTLRFPALRRGEYEVDALCVASAYPLGFLRATQRFAVQQRFVIYPEPAGDPKLPRHSSRAVGNRPQNDLGDGDDFSGVRAYVPGESQRHIDWKAVARGQAVMTKQFAPEAVGQLYLDFAATGLSDSEACLSQLTLWVIEAERARRPYGLRLPGAEIRPSLGDAHYHRCLRALALFT